MNFRKHPISREKNLKETRERKEKTKKKIKN